MPKTIAELRQELQDAGRDVRMAGEMVERVTSGVSGPPVIVEALNATDEAIRNVWRALSELQSERARQAEAAK